VYKIQRYGKWLARVKPIFKSMNFLAHLYLSGHDKQIQVGNFMADFVKGRHLENLYPANVVRGIYLHREIDDFTDHHPIVKKSKQRLWPRYRHYSAVIIDVFYDHFLARHWSNYHHELLPDYAEQAYQNILANHLILPDAVKWMMPHMMRGNWLANYAHVPGIARVLKGMAHRASFVSNMERATDDLLAHYADFEKEFLAYFPQLQQHTKNWLIQSFGNNSS